MKKLNEFNSEKRGSTVYVNMNESVKNGIACDKCSAELFDTHPNRTLTSDPPQKEVHCKKCGFIGYRLS